MIPAPERGLVVPYAYLWHSEHRGGREEGIKDRPCVIILVSLAAAGVRVVTVAPITHAAPTEPGQAVELPLPTKRRLGLDTAPSWIMVSEGNRFGWPGPDIRPTAGGRFDYGPLPPALFRQVQQGFAAYATAKRLLMVARSA